MQLNDYQLSNNCVPLRLVGVIQDAPIEYDDFEAAVLLSVVQCKGGGRRNSIKIKFNFSCLF